MDKVKELLTNHKTDCARLGVIKARLKQIDAIEDRKSVDKILEMTFSKPILDGMPKGNRTGSHTEYIALRYRDRVRQEMREQELERKRLEAERLEIETKIDMYVAAMESLNKLEAQLIHLRYTEGMTYNAISEKQLVAGTPSMFSVSTLRRMNGVALRKISMVLSGSNYAS